MRTKATAARAAAMTPQQPANQHELDRLKRIITAFPPHQSYSEDELNRIASCIVHQRAEIAAREARPDYATDSASLMIPARDNWFNNTYNHFLVIIDSPPERWDDIGMLFVSFDVIDPAREAREAAYYEEIPPPEIAVDRAKGADEIKATMLDFRNNFDWDEFQSQPVTGLSYYGDLESAGPQ